MRPCRFPKRNTARTTINNVRLASKYYDLFADSDDESRAGYIASFLPEGGRGADLGCGTGGVTLALKKRGFDVTGFDSSEGMLAAAYERAADSGETIDFVLKDVFRGGFGKNLDFVIACCDVVNYVSRRSDFSKRYTIRCRTEVCSLLTFRANTN